MQDIVFVLKAKNDAKKAAKQFQSDMKDAGTSVKEVKANAKEAATATKEMGNEAKGAARAYNILTAAVVKLSTAIGAIAVSVGAAALNTLVPLALITRMSKLVTIVGILAVAIGGLAALSGAVKAAREFNAAIAETSTLIQGTPQQLDDLSAAATRLTREFGGNRAAQVQGFYQAISAGAGSVAEASELLDVANRLAIGGVTDVQSATSILSTAINVYGSDVITAQEASDSLFIAMKNGVTTVGELADNLGVVLPLAKEVGLSFDEVSSAVAALTKGGLRTNVATTQLRALIASIIQAGKEGSAAGKAADKLGVDFSIAALKAKGLDQFLRDVTDAAGGNATALNELFGSIEATNAALAFAGSAGVSFTQILEEQRTKAGATGEAYEKVAEQLNNRLLVALAKLQVVGEQIGTVLLTVLVPAVEAVAGAVSILADNIDFLLIAMTGLTAAGIGPVIALMVRLRGVFLGTIAASGRLSKGVAALGTAFRGAGGTVGILSSALRAIPFFAVVSGLTALLRFLKATAKDTELLDKTVRDAADAWDIFTEAAKRASETRIDANLLDARLAADQAVEAARGALDAAQAELEKAQARSRLSGVLLFGIDVNPGRLKQARAEVARISGDLFEAKAAQSAFETATKSSGDALRELAFDIKAFEDSRTNQNLSELRESVATGVTQIERDLEDAQKRLEDLVILDIDGVVRFEARGASEVRAEIEALQADLTDLRALQSDYNDDTVTIGDSLQAQVAAVRTLALEQRTVTELSFAAVEPLGQALSKYGLMTGELRKIQELQNQIAVQNTRNEIFNIGAEVAELGSELKLTDEEAKAFFTSLNDIKNTDSFGQQARLARQLAEQIIQSVGGADKLEGKTLEVVSRLIDMANEAANGKVKVDQMTAAMKGTSVAAGGVFNAVASITGAFAGPIGQAIRLANILGRIPGLLGGISSSLRALSGAGATVFSGIKSTLKNAVNSGDSPIKGALDNIKDTFNQFVGGASTKDVKTGLADQFKVDLGDLGGGVGGGAGGGGAVEQATALEQAIEQLTGKYTTLKETVGLTELELEEYNIRQQLTKAAAQDGTEVTEAQVQSILSLRDAYLEAKEASQTFSEGAKAGFKDFADSVQSNMEFAKDFTKSAFTGLSNTIADFVKTGKADFKGLLVDLLGQIAEFLANRLIIDFLGVAGGGTGGKGTMDLFGGGGGGGGFLKSVFGGLFGGGLAKGGPARAGTPYLIGEEGPEFFVPRTSGNVMSHGESMAAMAAPAPVNITFNITTPDADSFRRSQGQIEAQMSRALDRANRRNN